ncbi:Ig-like domain-containing protein [Rhodohalobacter mucosus]|uniref:Uncharacterized protein n=1 Tax=Rhodohalobacter mucosus TaxID=2079485 RepID=A0A316TV62_9BACT|nr:invasin domain 3-containing protein [Rhodohalobacter mucosus]PWN07788.1 hypothetical protein DDZ15_01890 [Rhodohalobacter mucosus]
MKHVTLSLIFILTFAALPASVFGENLFSSFSPFPDTTGFPVTNLHNHFTAKEGLITDGNRVTEWRDQGGNGYHVTVPVDKDPDFTGPRIDLETLNGFPVPKWLENSGMRLERESFSPDPPLPTANVNMYYAVIKAPHAQGTWRFFWDAVSAYARQPLYTTYSDGRWWVRNGSNFTYVTVPDNEWVIVTIRYRNSSASDQGAQVYVNGVLVSDNPNSVRMSGGDGIRFGSAGNTSGERPPFSSTEGEFAMAERLHYDGGHTEEERSQVEHYLSTEWGIALDPVIKPVITSPALGTENIGLTPELQWTIDNDDTEFELVLGTEFNFLSDVLIDTVVTGKAFQVPSGVLNYNTEYWWKVRSTNPEHTAWSQMGAGLYQTGGFAFKTGSEPSEPPGAVTLLSPADGSTDVSTDPVLSWEAVDQATGYRLQVATDTGFSLPVVDEANLTGTDFSVTGLDAATVYYWRVMAVNAIGDGPWSSSWAFTTLNSGTASAMSVTQQPTAATAGAAISPAPAVTVTDGTNPVSGVTVTASLNGASLTGASTTTAITGVDGVASFANLVTETAGTGYTLTFEADAAGVANVDSDPFDVSAAAASTLNEISGNGQTGPISTTLAEAFVTEVQDAFGNPVAGETVDFSIATTPAGAAGQSLNTLSATTDAAGRAASTLTLGDTAGDYTTDATWNAATVSFTATAQTGAATALQVNTQPGTTTAGQTVAGPPSVLVTDSGGNPVSGVTVSVSEQGGYIFDGGTLSAVSDGSGVAAFSDLVINTAGTYTLEFSSTGLTTVASTAFDVTAAAASDLAIASGNTQSARINQTLAQDLTVEVTDAFGNPVSGITVDFATTSVPAGSAGQSLSSASAVTGVDGLASVSLTLGDKVGDYIVDASSAGLTTIQFTATATTGDPSAMSVTTQAGLSTAGQAIAGPPAVTVLDAGGNSVSGVNVSVSESGGYTLDGGTLTVATNASGVAEFSDLFIEAAGDYTLLFSADAAGVADVTSGPFTVQAAAASSIGISSIASPQTAGTPFSVTLTAVDAFGNVDDSFAETADLTTPAGTVSPATAAFAGGTVTLDVSVTQAGSGQTITATDGAISGTSNTFDVNPGAVSASGSSVTATSPHTADGSDAATVSIVLADANGNAIGGLTDADFAVGLGGSSALAGTVAETGTPGTYTVGVTNTVAESVTVTITADGLVLDDSPVVEFQAGPVTRLTIVEQPTVTTAGAAISPAPAVTVTDGTNPVSGVTVDVALTGAAFAAGSTTSVTTDGSGAAVFSNLLIETAGSGYTLTFSSSGLSDVVSGSFDVNPAAADPASTTATVPAGTAGALTTITVNVADAFGNAVTGEAANLAASVSGGPNAGEAVSAFSDDGGGSYSASYTPTAAGDDEITITLNTTGISGSPYTSTVSAGAAASFSFDTITSPQTAGANFVITITALDSEGNTANGYNGTATLTTTAGTITPASATFTAGVASLGVDVSGAGTGQTITAADGAVAGTSNTFDVNPGAVSASVSSVTATSPHTADGTDASTVTIDVQDANGNPISGFINTDFTVDLGLTAASPGTVSEIGTSGTYTVDVTNTTAESVSVTITANGVVLDDTPEIIFQTGAASAMSVTQQPTGSTAGAAISPAPAVTVTDGTNPVSGVTVTASLTGASLMAGSTTSAVTDVNGVASFANLVTETAGTGYRLTFDADAAGVVNVDSDPFDVSAAAASTLNEISGNGQTGPISTALAEAFVVEVQDAFGNPVSGEAVDFSIQSTPAGATGQSLSTLSTTTDAAGRAASTLTLGNAAGTYDVDAVWNATTISFTAIAESGAAAALQVNTQPGATTAGETISGPPSVQVTDSGGNPVSGVNVTVSESGGYILDGGTLTVATNASGVAEFTDLIIEAAGDYTLTFDADAADVTSEPFTVQAAAASSIEISTIASPQTAGTPFSVTMTALDAFGNIDDSFAQTAELTTTAGTVSPATAAFSGGTVTLDVSVTQAGTGQTITATNGAIAGTSNAFDVNPGAVSASVSSVTATSPHTADGSDASTVTIVLQDASGNAITGLTNTDFTVDLGVSSAAAGTVAETGTPGTYTVSVTNTAAEPVTVIITADGVVLDDSPVVEFQAGPVTRLTIVEQPAAATAGEAISPAPAVTVTDGTNPVSGVTVNVALTGAVFTAASTTSVTTDGSGAAAFSNLLIETAGSGYRLTFSSAGLSDVVSGEFAVTPAAADPASTTATVPDGTAGAPTTLTVNVSDAFGNAVTGEAANLAASVSGGPNAGAAVSAFSDDGGGSYSASYTPTATGDDQITITLNTTGISGSPYTSTVSAGAVSLVSPSDGSVGVSVNVILRWSELAGATSYRVQVAEDAEFMTLVSDEAALTDTEYSPGMLNYETTYYWRVLARNGAGNLDWSEVWSFRTVPEPISPPGAVSLVSPLNGALDVSVDALLSWLPVAQAADYRVQVSTDAGFATLSEEQAGLSATEFSTGSLDNSTTYYWRVRARNDAGEGAWSEVWSFQTVQTDLAKTMIESVYPNPFNPTANIQYQLAENSDVLIEIFDMAGKRLLVLVDARQNRGSYTIPFTASGLSSGIYFVRLRAGNTVSTEKFTIIK